MKKNIIAAFVSLLLLSGVCLAAETIQKGYISVNTEAVEELNPTTVKISFAIENQSKDAQSAAEVNKKSSETAINAVKALIDENKKETIKTTSYNISPQYNRKDGARVLSGYMASNTLQVTLKDIDKAGKVISSALSNGANSVSGLQFTIEDTNDECNILIQKASKEARQRADKIASSMQTTVTGIKNISAGCSTSQSMRSNLKFSNIEAASLAQDSMPVEAGKSTLRAYVNAEFFVK